MDCDGKNYLPEESEIVDHPMSDSAIDRLLLSTENGYAFLHTDGALRVLDFGKDNPRNYTFSSKTDGIYLFKRPGTWNSSETNILFGSDGQRIAVFSGNYNYPFIETGCKENMRYLAQGWEEKFILINYEPDRVTLRGRCVTDLPIPSQGHHVGIRGHHVGVVKPRLSYYLQEFRDYSSFTIVTHLGAPIKVDSTKSFGQFSIFLGTKDEPLFVIVNNSLIHNSSRATTITTTVAATLLVKTPV